MFQEKYNENRSQIYKISFSLDDIKPFVLLHIDSAQDMNNPHSLSRLRMYQQYHKPLEDWFKKNCNKTPSKADKLAFIILLSYPKQRVIDATSFDDFKLFTEKDQQNSDFKIINTIDLDYNDDEAVQFDEHIDCICSKDKLKYVTRVENKYSGIELYIGSECIKKYKIVSEEEIKKMNDINSKKKERQREINEGLPLGYYEEQRKIDKDGKIEEKNRKIEEKRKKARQKIKEKLDTGNYRYCYLCNTSLMNIKSEKNKRICESCVENDRGHLIAEYYPSISNSIIKKCQIYDCNNCDNPFNYYFSHSEYLCKPCTEENKIISCKICKTCVLLDIDSSDLYCESCEKKLINCVDCNQETIRWTNCSNRCQTCQLCYNNKMILVNCQKCNEEFDRKQIDDWRTFCGLCYNDIREQTPLCKCGKIMVLKTVKKEGANKGKKFFGCPTFPDCNSFIWI